MVNKVFSMTILLIVANGCVGTVRIAENSQETTRTNISKPSHDVNSSRETNLKK